MASVEDPFADFPLYKPGGEAPAAPAKDDPYADFPVVPGTDYTTGPAPTTAPSARITVRPTLLEQYQSGDQYQKAAAEDYIRMRDAGIPIPGESTLQSYGRRIGQGAGLGWTDELLAAGEVPFQMYRRGTWNVPEAYRYGKAFQDLLLAQARAKTEGVTGALHELAGGITAGIGGAGQRVAGTGVNYLKNIGLGGLFGTVAGAGEAPTVGDIPEHAKIGGLLGLGVGAALPPAMAGLGYVAQPFIRPLRNAKDVATEYIANLARNAGVTPQQIVDRIRIAHAEGQPFNVADVLGHTGQSALRSYGKMPGPQREVIQEDILRRNIAQQERLIEEFQRSHGVTGTAEQASTALKERAQTAAAPYFEQAKQIPTWSTTLDEFIRHPDVRKGIAEGVRQEVRRTVGTNNPFKVTDVVDLVHDAQGNAIVRGVRPNLQTIQTAKIGLDHEIETKLAQSHGEVTPHIQSLIALKNNMLAEVYKLNPAYERANQIFAGPMQVREAIKEGQAAARTGDWRDIVPKFQALRPTEQQGHRIGLVQTIMDQVGQGRFPGILRAESPKGVEQLIATALPGQALRNRDFLNREARMIKGGNMVMGGSPTMEIAAEMGATPGGLPEALNLVTAAAQGNYPSVLRQGAQMGARLLTGERQKHINEITRLLLARTPDVAQELANRIAAQNLAARGVNPYSGAMPRYQP